MVRFIAVLDDEPTVALVPETPPTMLERGMRAKGEEEEDLQR